jgi:hypothetical protein
MSELIWINTQLDLWRSLNARCGDVQTADRHVLEVVRQARFPWPISADTSRGVLALIRDCKRVQGRVSVVSRGAGDRFEPGTHAEIDLTNLHLSAQLPDSGDGHQ